MSIKKAMKLTYLFSLTFNNFHLVSKSNSFNHNNKEVTFLENKTINSLSLLDHITTKFIYFKKCTITINLENISNSSKYILEDCVYNSKTGSYVEIKDKSLNFHNITFFQYEHLLEKALSEDINKIQFHQCSFDADETTNILHIISTSKHLKEISLDNCSFENTNHEKTFMKHINEYVKTHNLSLKIKKSKTETNFTTTPIRHNNNIQFNITSPHMDAEEDNSEEEEKVSKIPKNLESMKQVLKARSEIIPPKTEKELIKDYKRTLTLSRMNNLSKQDEEELSYLRKKIDTILQLPINAVIRRDLSSNEIGIIVQLIFRSLFPAGLDEVLKILTSLCKDAILKGSITANNYLLIGAPGTGKSSVIKAMAYILCLIGSSEEEISLKLIRNAMKTDKDLHTLLSILEKSHIKHMAMIPINGVSDPDQLKGIPRFYVGSTMGKIMSVVQGLKAPFVICLDEVDKGGQKQNRNSARASSIEDVLLNLIDGQLWIDSYLNCGFTLAKNGSSLFAATANIKEAIGSTFADRFMEINIEAPTIAGKTAILLKWFLNWATHNKIIKNIQDYTMRKDPRGGIEYKIGYLSFSEEVLSYLINANNSKDGLRTLEALVRDMFTNINIEYNEKKKDIHINTSNLHNYISNQEFYETDNKVQNEIMVISEEKSGNHVLNHIYVAKIRNTHHQVHILDFSQESYYVGQDMAKSTEALLKNVSTLCPEATSTFGLSLVSTYFTNQQGGILIQLPSECSDIEYKEYYILAPLIIASISAIRNLPIRKGTVVIGRLLLNGNFVVGKGKIQKKIIGAAKYNIISTIVLPWSLKDNAGFQKFLERNKFHSHIKFIYAKDLQDILKSTLIAE